MGSYIGHACDESGVVGITGRWDSWHLCGSVNEKARAFYQRLGFISLSGENEHALFYPTKSIEQLFG